MKKRILSLLLAFAMAATLAPATALVGTSTAKAAAQSDVAVTSGAAAGVKVDFNASYSYNEKKILIIDIVKKDGEFNFTLKAGSNVKKAALSQNGKGSQKPDGGNLSFKVEAVKNKPGQFKFTANNVEKLKSGKYVQNIVLNGEDSGELISFKVSNEYKATLDLLGGSGAAGFTKNDKGFYEKWSTDISDDGLGDTQITLPSGTEVIRPGYTLDGWRASKRYEPGTTVTMTSDMTFTAIWVKDSYQLTLVGDSEAISTNENVGSDTVQVELGSVLPANKFKRTGYTFAGWTDVANGGYAKYPDKSVVNDKLVSMIRDQDNPELYAVWAPITYTVDFDANVPSGSKLSTYNVDMKDVKVVYGKSGIAAKDHRNTFSVNNYTFTGWALDKDGYNTITEFDDVNVNPEGKTSVTLYAQWQEGYSVVVYTNDFEASSNEIYQIAGPNDIDDIEPKVGYTKDGYTYADGKNVSGALDYDENGIAIIYPSFTKADEWVVSYDENSGYLGNVSINKATVNSGSIAFPKVTPESNWKFVGWDLVDTNDGDADELALMRADGYEWNERLTGSFSAKNIITILTDYSVKAYAAREINFRARYLPIADSANLSDVVGSTLALGSSGYAYGTTKAFIEARIADAAQILTKAKGNIIGTDANKVDGSGANNVIVDGVDSAITTLNKTYQSMPKNNDNNNNLYKVNTISVKASSKAANSGSSYKVTSGFGRPNDFKVLTKTDSTNPAITSGSALTGLTATDIVVKSLSAAKDITLSKGANAWDAVDATFAPVVGQVISASADNNKKYNVNINAAANAGVVTYTNHLGESLGSSVDKDDAVAKIKAEMAKGSFPGYINAKYQISGSADADINQYGTIDKGIAGADIKLPNGLKTFTVKVVFSDKAYTPNEEEKTDDEILAEEVAKAQSFLDKGIAVRLLGPDGNHYYLNVISEIQALLKLGFVQETDEKNSFKFSSVETAVFNTPIYRISRTGFGPHYAAEKEKDDILAAAPGVWTVNNGGAPIFYVSMNSAGNQVYRLYRPSLGVHHLALKAERDAIMAYGADWVDETSATNTWFTPAN